MAQTTAEHFFEQGRAQGFELGEAQGIEMSKARVIAQVISQGIAQGIAEDIEQGIVQGIERGILQGIERSVERGIEHGKIQAKQAAVLKALRLRFDTVPISLISEVYAIRSLERLDALFEEALTAKTLDEIDLQNLGD